MNPGRKSLFSKFNLIAGLHEGCFYSQKMDRLLWGGRDKLAHYSALKIHTRSFVRMK